MKKYLQKFWTEFKTFAFKGNVIDLAVGMIIGSAFTAIVSELVNSIFTPILSLFNGAGKLSEMKWTIGSKFTLPYGSFLQAVLSFIVTALCLFLVVKAINKVTSMAKKDEKKEEPKKEPPRLCPYCFSEIHKDATRCPHCTSELTK